MKKVLIVDDEECVAKAFGALVCECPDTECEIETDATKAMMAAVGGRYDAAVVDLNLKSKECDGSDIARECIMMGTPVIICSGSSMLTKLRSYFNLKEHRNYVVHLDKPIVPSEFIETLKSMMSISVDHESMMERMK